MNAFAVEEASREISEVNVVPLADVSLVLLIILLVLSPMMAQSSLRVKSSAANTSPDAAEDRLLPQPVRVLVVGLDEKSLTLDGRSYDDPGAFMGALKDALAGRADRKVFLAPGPETPHGLVVHTIETIKSCGADSVALVQTQDDASVPELKEVQR